MTQMTPKEALGLILQAAALAMLSKQQHVQVEQAGAILLKEIEKEEKREERPGERAAPFSARRDSK